MKSITIHFNRPHSLFRKLKIIGLSLLIISSFMLLLLILIIEGMGQQFAINVIWLLLLIWMVKIVYDMIMNREKGILKIDGTGMTIIPEMQLVRFDGIASFDITGEYIFLFDRIDKKSDSVILPISQCQKSSLKTEIVSALVENGFKHNPGLNFK